MQNWRANLIFIFIILFGATIIGRLFFIQILNHHFYKALAQGQQKDFGKYQGERGEIFFRNGEPLAINKNWKLVFASPNEIEMKEETAQKLSEIISVDRDLILEKLKKDTLYVVIKDKLSDEEIEKLKKENLPGIYLRDYIGRYYPQGGLASQLIGFLDANGEGKYGLERYYDQILRGKEYYLSSSPFSLRDSSEFQGTDLTLTLDYHIQFKAEELLKGAFENLGIREGQIIVLEPNSGEIIALANFPNFDPNNYSTVENLEIFKNGITQKIFEPGSVFKPITMAMALDRDLINPQTTYQDPGVIKIDGWSIYNYDQRIYPGQITMTEVLEKSINTGAVFVQQKIPNQVFLNYLEKFGIFEKTGIDLPEFLPENKEFKKGYQINFVTASFGQGIEMTPIQLARTFCAIANGGKLVKPHLVKNGDVGHQPPQVISQKTASQLTAMLVSVVENGFGRAAKIPGYFVAGKTGTSLIPRSALGINKIGYSDQTWQTFVGFAPAFNPKFLILVKLDNPKTKTAEYSAVPIFHRLAEYIINYWQIPPDYEL